MTYAATRGSHEPETYAQRMQRNAEGRAYTVYTWPKYHNLPGLTRHLNGAWHPPLHQRHVPRQGGAKSTGSIASGGASPPNNHKLRPCES